MLAEHERLQLQEAVLSHVAFWQERLGLRDWRIRHRWREDAADSTGAAVTAQWEQMIADITWNLAAMHESPEDIELYVVHELVHVVLDELAPVEETKGEERVTAMLTAAFLRVAGE